MFKCKMWIPPPIPISQIHFSHFNNPSCQNSGNELDIPAIHTYEVKHLPCPIESIKVCSFACETYDPSPAPVISKLPLSLACTEWAPN